MRISLLALAMLAGACTPKYSGLVSVPPERPVPSARQSAPASVEPAPAKTLADRYRKNLDRIAKRDVGDEVYAWLKQLCEGIGPRLSGSENLERAIEWAEARMKERGIKAWTEPVEVRKWVRGAESLKLLPAGTKLEMIGLGDSVPTPKGGVTGELLVVKSFDELEQKKDQVKGKIVLFDVKLGTFPVDEWQFPSYGQAVAFRRAGPSLAAKHGAKAMLLRSITSDPQSPPHTGTLDYDANQPKIPAAAVSYRAADQLVALAEAGKPVRLSLELQSEDDGMVPSANVLAEIVGKDKPEEIVLLGGHIDSWDVGQGAHDNGAGVVSSMMAMALVKELGLEPRRTLRMVLWTNEENGEAGAAAYAKAHGAERHVAAMESDTGGTPVFAISLQGGPLQPGAPPPPAAPEQLQKLNEVVALLKPLGVKKALSFFSGADLQPLVALGVPTLGVFHWPEHYFDVHHSKNDTVERVKAEDLAQSSQAMASLGYLLADMEDTL